MEGDTVSLACQVSKPVTESAWFKDDLEVLPDDHYEMATEGTALALTIHDVGPEDEAEYTLEVGDHSSTAKLLVEGVTLNHLATSIFALT